MKEKRFGTLKGLEAPILQYESIAELDAAGGPDTALNEANGSLVYRGPLDDARDIICMLVEAETGVKRGVIDTGQKTKAGKAITKMQPAGEYVNEQCAAKGWKDLTHLQSAFDTACRNFKSKDAEGNEVVGPLAADAKKSAREGGSAKLALAHKTKAAAYIAGGVTDKFGALYTQQTGRAFPWTATGQAEPSFTAKWTAKDGTAKEATVSNADAESLGWLVKDYLADVALKAAAAMPE